MGEEYGAAREDGVHYVNRLDPDFPEKLKGIPSPPAGLYYTGRLPDPKKKSVSIIGSRVCSQYGRNMAEYFAKALAEEGVQVISGLARGIDGISQEATADAGGESFGILGCGTDVVYPIQNEGIYRKVRSSGGLISEYPPGTGPRKAYFAERNRLISGLCDILLVIEAKVHSGTLITVRCALEQGRDIFAVPGRLTDSVSAGCNRLIAEGAGIALSPKDILSALHVAEYAHYGRIPSGKDLEAGLSEMEKKAYEALDLYPKTLDDIMRDGRLSLSEAMEAVISLALKGLAKECAKNHYVKVR